MRVLVVEDEATLRDTLRTRLAEAGFTVDVARDGEEGLFAGLEYPLDVAIIDLGLPKLPGLEVIRRLRAAHKTLPDPDSHRARQLAGQGRGPAGRRRRLRGQAVPFRGGAGAPAGAAAPRRRLGERRS